MDGSDAPLYIGLCWVEVDDYRLTSRTARLRWRSRICLAALRFALLEQWLAFALLAESEVEVAGEVDSDTVLLEVVVGPACVVGVVDDVDDDVVCGFTWFTLRTTEVDTDTSSVVCVV